MIAKPMRNAFATAALATLIACGCTTQGTASAAALEYGAVFVVVRHAEKATDDPKDPTLSEAGRARAQRVAERLAKDRVSAVYATGYRRTQLTAATTAHTHALVVRTYDAAMPAADFSAQLRKEHTAGVVLVVGHSNTVSSIAGALCACAVTPLREDEYDRWITIRIDRNGAATMEESRY